MIFKIGDKVRILYDCIDNDKESTQSAIGKVGIIDDIWNDGKFIEVTNLPLMCYPEFERNMNINLHRNTNTYEYNQLELFEEPIEKLVKECIQELKETNKFLKEIIGKV